MKTPFAKISAAVILLIVSAAFALFGQETKLPPIGKVATDETGRILVNGKPFFPIVLYDVPAEAATLKSLHEQGFNTAPIAKPEDAATLLAAGFYGMLHGTAKAQKLEGILFGVGMDSPALSFKEGLLEKVKTDLQTVHGNIPDRPAIYAIGYWDNEPAGVKANTILGKDKYDDLIQIIDVAGPYLYPVPYQPIGSVGDAVGRAKAASGGKKAVVPFLQTFVWDAKDRYPTPAEIKCMVYLSLINGANGIGYYSYGSVTGKPNTTIEKEQPELWKAVCGANKEAIAIAAYLADGSPNDAVKLGEGVPEVKMRAVQHAGGSVILLANTAATAKTATLQLPPSATILKRLDGGKEATVTGGKAAIELQPCEAVGLTY